MAHNFPQGFFWGAATSSHQVEGGNTNDWTEWEGLGRVKNGSQSGLAADHFHRFRDDFSLAKKLGHNAHRLSIEWSRIEPTIGVFDSVAIAHYREVFQTLRQQGLEPFVTLHHFTNPIWFAKLGGWEKRKNIDHFLRFVERMAKEFSSEVRYWITINEPTVYTSLGYLDGRWPPQRKSYRRAWVAIRNLLHAHRGAYAILHRYRADAYVGSANNLVDYQAHRRWHLGDQIMKFFATFWHNTWWLSRTKNSQDFLGLNYYFYHALRFRLAWPAQLFAPEANPSRPQSDLGWEINPTAFGRVLRWLSRYHKPIIITENGIADATDRLRPSFIIEHIREIQSAIRDGVDIRGYLHWSLLDNFEWADGFGPRFGLIKVDYVTQQRTPRPSAFVYEKICRSNGGALDDLQSI